MNTELIVDVLIKSIQCRDANAVEELLAEDIVFIDVPSGITQGRSKVKEMFQGFFAAATEIQWEVLNKIVQGNIAVIERINHLLINGKNITLSIVTIVEVTNGKISAIRDYFDHKTFSDQVST